MADDKVAAEAAKVEQKVGMAPLDELHTSDEVKRLAHKGWETGQLSPDEVKSLCGSVMRHIQRHQPAKKGRQGTASKAHQPTYRVCPGPIGFRAPLTPSL